MQQIEAVIQPSKLNEVKDALEEMGINDYMESPVLCHSRQSRQPLSFRGAKLFASSVEKIRLEVIAADEVVAQITEAIGAIAGAGDREECRIAVRPYREVV